MELKTVTIPLRKNGYLEGTQCYTVVWECPVCKKPRGGLTKSNVIEETQRYTIDSWVNPCGHVDKYLEVEKEATQNGLNSKLIHSFMKMHIYSIPEDLSCSYHSLRTGVSHDLYISDSVYYNGKPMYYNEDGLLMNDVPGFTYAKMIKRVEVLSGLKGSYPVENGFVMLPEKVSLPELKKMNLIYRVYSNPGF